MSDQTDGQDIDGLEIEAPRRGWGVGRILLCVVGGVVGFIGIIVAIAFWATSGIVDVGDQFLAKIRASEYEAAYALTSTGFKKSGDLEAFKTFIDQRNLSTYTSGSWGSRETSGMGDGATGTLEGSLVSPEGATNPFTLELIKEDGNWRIYAFNIKYAGTQTAESETPSANKVPPERELIDLVHASNIVFAKAVAAGSMDGFHKHIAALWAKQHSVEKLDGFFATFIEKKINLLPLQNVSPVFSGPATIDEDGLLIVNGFYHTSPSSTEFRHKYILEGFGWKLVGYRLIVEPIKKDGSDDNSSADDKAENEKDN